MEMQRFREDERPRRKKNTGRRRRKRQPKTLLFSLVILLLVGGAVGIYTLVFNKRESTVSMTSTEIPATSTYWNTGDGILYQTDGQIHFYHLQDQKKNYTYGTGASDIRMAGSSKMTAVYNEMSMQIIGKKKALEFTGRVLALECGYEHVAVLQQNESGVQSILILTPDGDQTDQIAMDAEQYVVDFGFYQTSSEMLWIEQLAVNAGTPTTSIRTYDLKKKSEAGVMQVQSQLVDQTYITSNSFFVVGTNQIIRFVHDGNKELYRTTVYGYEVIDYTLSDKPTFLMAPRGGDFHSVKMLTLTEGEEADAAETYLQLPTEGVAAYMMNGQLVVVSHEKVFIYTLKGKLSKEATLELPVDSAVKLSERVLMLSSNGIYYLATI